MDLGQPIVSVIPVVQGSVLVVLANTTRPLSQVEITALVKPAASRSGVRRALFALERSGLATREDHPPAALYVFNREHLAAAAILELARLREGMIERFKHEFARWKVPPLSAVLFGSAARGDGDSESDIDVMIIRPDDVSAVDKEWARQRGDLARHGSSWTGNEVNAVEYQADVFRRLWQGGEALLMEADAEGVVLAGLTLHDLATSRSAPAPR